MRYDSRIEAGTRQSLSLRVDPRLVLAGQLLELNSIELRTAIEAELQENPALEWLDEGLEGYSNEQIIEQIAPYESGPSSEDRQYQRSLPNDAEEHDWLDFAGCDNTLEDHLEAQLIYRLCPDAMAMANVLIASIDDRGYLGTTLEELALEHRFDYDQLEQTLFHLQDCEPAGVGARNLQECLALQLRNSDSVEGKLAYEILVNSFDDLVERNVRILTRRYRVVPELLQAAFDAVQSCTPYPADAFARESKMPHSSRGAAVPVDLHIARTESGWLASTSGISAEDLIVSRAYRQRLHELKNQHGGDEKRHLTAFASRAEQFIDAIRQRQGTLLRIGYYLIEHQSGFVLTGDYAFLRPLTRRKLAEDLGVHESTISRATTGKHVQIANGETISFDVFFKPALRIQQMIAEILATEAPGEALSDERIAALLADRGVHVARRTVNKYRDRAKMLSSRRRQTA